MSNIIGKQSDIPENPVNLTLEEQTYIELIRSARATASGWQFTKVMSIIMFVGMTVLVVLQQMGIIK